MGVAEMTRLWERLAFVRRVWGIPQIASADDEELRFHVLSCICEVFFHKKLSTTKFNQTATDHALSVRAGVGLSHSCWPNSHVRFEDYSGAMVQDETVQRSTLVVYAIADISIGEEIAICR